MGSTTSGARPTWPVLATRRRWRMRTVLGQRTISCGLEGARVVCPVVILDEQSKNPQLFRFYGGGRLPSSMGSIR